MKTKNNAMSLKECYYYAPVKDVVELKIDKEWKVVREHQLRYIQFCKSVGILKCKSLKIRLNGERKVYTLHFNENGTFAENMPGNLYSINMNISLLTIAK